MLKLSPAQRRILRTMLSDGKPLCEFLTPDTRRLFFRTLGDTVQARLNYVLDDKRVPYQTFRVLFKRNLIAPSKYRGSLSPQSGIVGYHVTEWGRRVLGFK